MGLRNAEGFPVEAVWGGTKRLARYTA